jgi:phosphohistidine phosphatase SixA
MADLKTRDLGGAIVLVRHAFVEDGVDPPLSTYGRLQASHLGVALRRLLDPPIRVLVSPARRTIETASHLYLPGSGWPEPITCNALAIGSGAVAIDQHAELGGSLLVTHEDVLSSIVEALTGSVRLGYARASATIVTPSGSGWRAEYHSLERLQAEDDSS